MAFDPHVAFHEAWLGMVQPVEGLVVSIPVLVEAQTMERHGPELQARFQELCPRVDAASGLALADDDARRSKRDRAELAQRKLTAHRRYRDLAELLRELLGWTPDLYDVGAALPTNLSRYIAEGHQTLRPTLALRKLAQAQAPVLSVRPERSASDSEHEVEGPELDEEPDTDSEDADEASADTSDDTPARPTGRSLTSLPDIETPESLAGKPYVALVWELPPGLPLDRPETVTGDWRYPPASKFDRLLRACRVPIGVLTNHEVIRLVYAPHGEASGSITFDLTDMGDVGGRPILDAFLMLLHANRFFGVRDEDALPALLRKSRERQANVTNALAAQVFDALDLLLRGFEAAAARDRHADLPALLRHSQGGAGAPGSPFALSAARSEAKRGVEGPDAQDEPPADDHLYGGLLTVLLRLVFILYAEDRELLPTSHPLYARSLSLGQLFEDLQRDHDAFPDTMNRRFGAWARLCALFRVIHDGAEHDGLHIPRRRGELFDPSRFPFLESWAPPGDAAPSTDELSALGVPTVDDETIYRVLERLLYLEGQRLSYKVLTVEQIGSVYEALMGYGAQRLEGAAVCCRHKSLQKDSTGGVWIEAAPLLAESPAGRAKFLVKAYDVEKGAANKIAADLKAARDEAAVLDALDRIALRRVPRRAGGQLVLQPGEERRRTSSHYTPRSLSEPIVRRTLEPLIQAMSDKGEPSSRQLLSLKVCDPAMGSGAFLVAACRFLGDHLVAAWEREGQTDKIASAREDVVNHARRLVAQTCLYGVDKNPFAVSLAKLSLWLETLAKDEPFTFVDHALRHGDSLVGLSFEQLQAFHWAPASQLDLIEQELAAAIAESLGLRQQILDLAGDSTPGATRLKEQLLWDAHDAQERLRVIGDLVIGAFFDVPKKEREPERRRRLDAVRTWLATGGDLPADLRDARDRTRRKLAPFHWHLEFPEVFHHGRRDPLSPDDASQSACMDAFVGNPPFAGKNGITRTGGPQYLDWLKALHAGSHGNADLSAHFFRRAAFLLGAHGTLGIVATNTIAQGDTRMSGLQPLVQQGNVIYDAIRSMLWPGDAAVAVSVVHLGKGHPAAKAGQRTLNGAVVQHINTRLRPRPERGDPHRLRANERRAFQGTIVLGMGFTLSPAEREELLALDRRNEERITPFLGGKEVNTSVARSFDRYIINFGELQLADAGRWPSLLRIVEERVKPERAKAKHSTRPWWLFERPRHELYASLADTARCLVTCIHAKHLVFSFQSPAQVFSHALLVFPLDSYASFACLQSRVHEQWARLLSSSMKDDLRYVVSDCFETFPFPSEATQDGIEAAFAAGRCVDVARTELMTARNLGLTMAYNQLKDPECRDPEIEHLRQLHIDMDKAVLAAYGWSDIPVPPYTTPVTDDEWKAKEAFEDEVIDRLFALNAERAAEEKLLGASSSPGNKPPGSKRAPSKRSTNSRVAPTPPSDDQLPLISSSAAQAVASPSTRPPRSNKRRPS